MSGEKELARLEPGHIRASDTERRRVIATLQAACVEGRLNLDEYGQRVENALAARTRGQLETLLVDVPAETGGGGGPGMPRPSAACAWLSGQGEARGHALASRTRWRCWDRRNGRASGGWRKRRG